VTLNRTYWIFSVKADLSKKWQKLYKRQNVWSFIKWFSELEIKISFWRDFDFWHNFRFSTNFLLVTKIFFHLELFYDDSKCYGLRLLYDFKTFVRISSIPFFFNYLTNIFNWYYLEIFKSRNYSIGLINTDNLVFF